MVIILASESEVRGFDPGRGRCIFSEHKNPEYDFLRKRSKAVGPGRRFTASKRTSEQNLTDFSRSLSEATLMA